MVRSSGSTAFKNLRGDGIRLKTNDCRAPPDFSESDDALAGVSADVKDDRSLSAYDNMKILRQPDSHRVLDVPTSQLHTHGM